jgi:uncharacterized sodium:solute symporter family permease YidK
MAWLLDSGVLLAYFITVIGIGLYKGRGDKTMEGFAVGNRSIPWWAVLASILAAEISAATFLGAPDEGYASRNYTYAQLAVGTLLARVVVALVFIKPYYDLRVVSIYEFLRVRFGERTKNGASAVFLITRALASGTRLYVAAVVLVLGYEMFSGVALAPLQQVWIYIGSLVFLTAATSIYTALGGIKAVVWTDVIQATVMFGRLVSPYIRPKATSSTPFPLLEDHGCLFGILSSSAHHCLCRYRLAFEGDLIVLGIFGYTYGSLRVFSWWGCLPRRAAVEGAISRRWCAASSPWRS